MNDRLDLERVNALNKPGSIQVDCTDIWKSDKGCETIWKSQGSALSPEISSGLFKNPVASVKANKNMHALPPDLKTLLPSV